MKRRGLMIIHSFQPGRVGGTELQAERLASRLVTLGHPMDVLTALTMPNAQPEETFEGVQIHRVSYPLALGVKKDITNTFRYLVTKRSTYDVLHAHMAYGHAVVAVVVAKSFRKKCIIKLAGSGRNGDLFNLSKFDGFNQAIKILYQADAIVATSDELERESLAFGFPHERLVRIPNGVDTNYFRRSGRSPESEKTRFVLVGRRDLSKGIDFALGAAKLLMERGLGNCFEVAFYGADCPGYDFEELAHRLHVHNVVHFFPFEQDMPSVYEASHCLILPSRSEGLSNALLEAMAMELPVIASRVSGTPDVVKDGEEGLLMEPESLEALADNMELIIRNPDLASRLGKNARAKVLVKFSLESVAKQYSDLYQQL